MLEIVKLSKTQAWVTLHDHDVIVEHCNFFLSALNEAERKEKKGGVERKRLEGPTLQLKKAPLSGPNNHILALPTVLA